MKIEIQSSPLLNQAQKIIATYQFFNNMKAISSVNKNNEF